MKTSLLCGALLLVSSLATAQAPQWTVVVTPTLNPLPLGMCGAVHLTLIDPVTRDVPRNPQGYRIDMAAFDMTVSGGTSAAGQQIDASHFNACGCQGGAPGSTATVTATYPAQSLPAAKRVPGVSIQQSATFTLAPPKGATNPPSCLSIASNAAAGGVAAGAAAGGGAVGAGAAGGPQSSAAGSGSAPSGAVGGAAAEAAAAGSGATSAAAGGGAVGAGASSAPPSSGAGSAASGAAGPATAGGGMAGAGAGRAGPSQGAVTTGAGAVRGAATGTTGPVATAPVPVNPTGLIANRNAAGEIGLVWNQVPDASFYVVFGPGFTPGGQRFENVINADARLYAPYVQVMGTHIPAGTHEWLVASYYSPGNISTPASQYSRVSLTVSAPRTAATTPPATTPPSSAPPASTPPAAAALSGQYLVTLTGIRCYQASMDDLLSRDGMGDEIYASTYIRRFDRRTGQLVDTSTRRSTPHGDVQHFGNQRLQAGSRSQTGGIQDGDMIPGPALIALRSVVAQDATFPMRLWQGTLTDGVDALIMSPSLWEQDVGDAYHAQWLQNQQMLNQSLFAKQGVQDQISQNAFGALIFGMSGNDNNAAGLSMGRLVVDTGMMALGAGVPILSLLTTSADRPIGLVQNGRDVTGLPNHTVILTREIIEAALARPALGAIPSPVANLPSGGLLAGGIPAIARVGVIAPKPGIIVVHLQERDISGTLAFPERPAIYQMYIQVERVP